jgi:hypothetical protein
MNSPFPGMDPYLEQFWPDVHARLILYACDQLEEQLPSNLIARVEERVVFEIEAEETRPAYPDVKITERPGKPSAAVALVSRAAGVEPVIVEYQGPETETYINILEAGPGQRLVTVIEVLSMANKLPGDARRQYRRKQAELRQGGVSLVEIDLLRRGPWTLSVPRDLIPARARTPYQACVRRGWRPRRFEVYPLPLRKPLPAIGIPLRETDQDVTLDLQAILHTAYRKGRYQLTIDYAEPPDPPLRGADVKWARSVIKKARKNS